MTSPSMELVADARAAGLARGFLRHHCHHHDQALYDTAELLVSEVVTNAVRHDSPPVTMTVICDDPDGMVVRVEDGGHEQLTARQPQMTDEGGRGLMLVDALSTHWGAERTSRGKTVWFEVRASVCRPS